MAIAGLLSHAGYLGGSHYAQRWGLSAGVTALILALQPMLTALIMSRWLHERLSALQMLGVAVGLGGVALVVGHRVDGAAIALREPARRRLGAGGVTAGTLYQRQFCATVDLRSAVCIHFAVTALVLLPLGAAFEGFAIQWNWQIAATLLYHVVLGVDRRLHHPPPAAAPRPGDQRHQPALPHAAGRGAGGVGDLRRAADGDDVARHGGGLHRRGDGLDQPCGAVEDADRRGAVVSGAAPASR